MSDPKFTPGPWRATSTGMSRFIDATIRPGVAQEVAWCGVTEAPEQMDANARLIAAAPELFAALIEGRRAIGDHFAPNDCYATGPLTGNAFRDLVQCPACSFIGMFDEVMEKARGES